jgi:hypothetical protein
LTIEALVELEAACRQAGRNVRGRFDIVFDYENSSHREVLRDVGCGAF